jgi:branched-subunit amino acid ABC-type transport system permease component
MLGFVFMYFIGKYFYELAQKANKTNGIMWLFAVLGVISYYVGTFVGGILIGVFAALFDINLEYYPEFGITLMAVPFGFLLCFGFYTILKNTWKSKERETYIKDDDILDSNF